MPSQSSVVELPSRTLGIVGLGAIGGLVADTAIKLGMKAIGFDPEITVDAAWRLPASVRKANSIDEVMRHADFVTLHVPLLPVTRHLVDARRLALLKPHAVLLNFARDAIVDEDAVVEALRAQKLRAYITELASSLVPGQRGLLKAQILAFAQTVAESAGGFLGMKTVSAAEKAAMTDIESAFG